jgi:hypothetical protein
MADHEQVEYATTQGNDLPANVAMYDRFVHLIVVGGALVANIILGLAIGGVAGNRRRRRSVAACVRDFRDRHHRGSARFFERDEAAERHHGAGLADRARPRLGSLKRSCIAGARGPLDLAAGEPLSGFDDGAASCTSSCLMLMIWSNRARNTQGLTPS